MHNKNVVVILPKHNLMPDGEEGRCCCQCWAGHRFTLPVLAAVLQTAQHNIEDNKSELLSLMSWVCTLLVLGCLSSLIAHMRSLLCPLASHKGNPTRQMLIELSLFCPLWNTWIKAQSCDLFELVSLYRTVWFKIMLLSWASPSSFLSVTLLFLRRLSGEVSSALLDEEEWGWIHIS